MFGIRYFKADSSTYVIRTSGGKVLDRGNGLSFFYLNSAIHVYLAAVYSCIML